MAQVIENRTQIDGTITSRVRHPTLRDYDVLGIDVDAAAPVEGVADLLSSRVGSRIDVAVKRDLLPGGSLVGKRLRSRVYVGGPGSILAEPFPTQGAFTVEDA